MVRTEHDIVSQVQSAKTDSEAADALIRQYMGFIRSETVKFLHTAPENGHEDELSIAMLAFYEAVLAYERNRGAFLPYAARAIKNRLIDHYRTEKRHGNVISLHTPLGGEEDGGELLDTIPDTVDHAEDYAVRTASRREIQEFSEKLAQFGLTFSDVADNCPRQERTFAACRRVLDFARTQPELLKRVEDTGKLPMGELSAGSGTDRKTMERHRKYLVAILLAFYEAVLAYEKSRGAFLPYAARAIKNRLIDHYRTEKRHGNVISLHTPLGGEEDGGELLDTIPDTVDHAGDYAVRTASRREIQEFSEKLAQFGLTFSDVADNCPRQERTFAACRRVLDFARTQPELLKRVEDTGKLPMGELSAGSGTDKKTIERHRKYLVAILLAFTNGYEIIRGHLCQVGPKRGGDEA